MRFCWANYTLWAVIALFGISAVVAGCGAKGPLYLPERPQPEAAEAATPPQTEPADLPDPQAGPTEQ